MHGVLIAGAYTDLDEFRAAGHANDNRPIRRNATFVSPDQQFRWSWIKHVTISNRYGSDFHPRRSVLTADQRKCRPYRLNGVWYRMHLNDRDGSVQLWKWRVDYGTSLCVKTECCRRGGSFQCINRDMNACYNIFKAFLWETVNHRRPAHLMPTTPAAAIEVPVNVLPNL